MTKPSRKPISLTSIQQEILIKVPVKVTQYFKAHDLRTPKYLVPTQLSLDTYRAICIAAGYRGYHLQRFMKEFESARDRMTFRQKKV